MVDISDKGFQGTSVNCHVKGKFKIDVGTGDPQEVELIILHSKGMNYDCILGFDLQRQLRISVDHSTEPPCFLHRGTKLTIHKMTDNPEDDDSICALKDGLEKPASENLTLFSCSGVTLRGEDVYFLSCKLECDQPGLYEVFLGG